MILIEWIQKNNDVLLALHKAGLLSHTVFFYRNLYLDYDARVIMGICRTDAVLLTADKFRVSESTVYRAIKSMRGSIPENICSGNFIKVDN